MGQEIVYCFKCQNRLLGSDFQRGKAFKVSGNVACGTCILDLLAQHPDPKAELERLKREAGRTNSGSSITSSQLKVQRADAPAAATSRVPLAEPPPNKSPAPVYVGVGILAVAVVLAVAVASSGTPPRSELPESGRGAIADGSRTRIPLPPSATSSAPRSAGQVLKDDLRELDDQTHPLIEQGQIRDAAAILEAAQPRHSESEWSLSLASRLGSLLADGRRRTAPLFERAVAAARRGDTSQVLALRKQVETQSTRALLDEFDRAVSGLAITAEPEVKAPPPLLPSSAPALIPAPSRTPLELYGAEWVRAASPAAVRNLAAAVRELEKLAAAQTDPAAKKQAEGDLQDLRLAQDAFAELPRLAPRLPKGQKMALEFLGGTGAIESVEGTIASAGANLIMVLIETELVGVPVAEVTGSTVATLLALRGEKRSGDLRAVQLISALDGRKIATLEKYETLKREPTPEDIEARRLYMAAESQAGDVRTRALAVDGFLKLLDRAGTSFVDRNRRAIEERLTELRDFTFLAEDLRGAGCFLASTTIKGDPMWQSESPGKGPSTYVEAEFYVQSNLTYQGWVYGYGCCQEIFSYGLQGTGLSGVSGKNLREQIIAEPGGEDAIAPRLPSGLRKKHAEHAGQKGAERWEWIALGALKFSGPGLKVLRILTDQKGFGVGAIVISASRSSLPREAEIREILKNHPPVEAKPTGQVYREIFREVPGTLVSDLTSSAKFREGRADMTGMVGAFDSWNMGENYGCRMRGFVHPPATGEYFFWLSSDDEGELWLSPDDTPARKVRIVALNQAVDPRSWDKLPNQKSAPIALVAGRRYYVEVLQKQGSGNEHVAVGWTLPGGAQERPIPSSRLSAWGAFAGRKARRSPGPSFAPGMTTTVITLPIDKAALRGGTLGRYGEGEGATLQGFNSIECQAEWAIDIPFSGRYKVELVYACEPNNGGTVALSVGDEKLAIPIPATGGWEAYRPLEAGPLNLPKGRASVILKPSEIHGGLMNLKGVRLVPAP